jgi:hypothetical protein
MALERALFDRGWGAHTIDGDNVRRGLNADLGFSPEDRQENIRRVGEVAALLPTPDWSASPRSSRRSTTTARGRAPLRGGARSSRS